MIIKKIGFTPKIGGDLHGEGTFLYECQTDEGRTIRNTYKDVSKLDGGLISCYHMLLICVAKYAGLNPDCIHSVRLDGFNSVKIAGITNIGAIEAKFSGKVTIGGDPEFDAHITSLCDLILINI